MGLVAALNEIPHPVWIVAMVIGFVWHWPIGLAILAYLIGSGRIGRRHGPGRWYNMPPDRNGAAPGTWANRWPMWGCCFRHDAAPPPSSNAAFDDYRAETLRRLEEEQREFQAYLERLRRARDKAEFDQFMNERRGPRPDPETP